MSEDMKGKITILILSSIINIVVVYFAFSLNTRWADDTETAKRIDGKLDVTRYEKDCERNEVRFERLEAGQQRDREVYIEEVTEIKTHLLYIRRAIENGKR